MKYIYFKFPKVFTAYTKFFCCLLFVISAFSCKETDLNFTEKLIKTFKSESINKDKIDWNNFEKLVLKKSKKSRDSAIILALTLNNNPHSFYQKRNKILFGNFTSEENDSCLISKKFDEKKFRDIGFVKVKTFYNSLEGHGDEAKEYVNTILEKIKASDKKKLSAWIIDLRGNRGGDMWPMLISLTPFFTNDVLGFFQIGNSKSKWLKINDKIYINDDCQNDRISISPINYRLKNSGLKIAVLIDNKTQSSGEGVAIALKSLSNVKFFGTQTYGFATSNKPIKMGFNEYLVLTTGAMVDFSGKEYPKGIVPDYKVCSFEELEKSVFNYLNSKI